jgi:hypothetical protein
MGEGAGGDGRPERGLRRPEGGLTAVAAVGPREGHELGEIGVGGNNEETLDVYALLFL